MDEHTTDTMAFNGEWIALDCCAVRWMWAYIYVEGERTQWRTMACDSVQWRRNAVGMVLNSVGMACNSVGMALEYRSVA